MTATRAIAVVALLLCAGCLHSQEISHHPCEVLQADLSSKVMECYGPDLVPIKQKEVTRILIGPAGGTGLGNDSFGVETSIEAPVSKHIELDATNVFSPIFTHPGTGKGGFTDQVTTGGIVWFKEKFGLYGGSEYSYYKTSELYKGANYLRVGPVFKAFFWGAPLRINLEYIRQFRNGIDAAGIETNRINGVSASINVRLTCTGAVCWRVKESLTVAHGYNQGNPNCDGTFGPQICGPRTAWTNGAWAGSLLIEFPHRKDAELNEF